LALLGSEFGFRPSAAVFPDEPELVRLAFDNIAYEELKHQRDKMTAPPGMG